MAAEPETITLATHPPAKASIRRIRAFGGLLAWAIVAFATWTTQQDLYVTASRGLAAGVAGLLFAWWVGLLYWRLILQLQQRSHLMRVRDRKTQS